MAKVKVLQDFRADRMYRKGEVVELEDRIADYYVRLGRACSGCTQPKVKRTIKKKPGCSPCDKSKTEEPKSE